MRVYLSGLPCRLYRPAIACRLWRGKLRAEELDDFDIDRLQAFYGSSLGRMSLEMVARAGRRAFACMPMGWTCWASAMPTGCWSVTSPARGSVDVGLAGCTGRRFAGRPKGRAWPRWSRKSGCRFPMRCSTGSSCCHAHGGGREPPAPAARILAHCGAGSPNSDHRRPPARVCGPGPSRHPSGTGGPIPARSSTGCWRTPCSLPPASARALYAPPIGWGLITSAGDAWEKIGRFAWTGFGGVLMIEAMKRLYIEPGRPARGPNGW